MGRIVLSLSTVWFALACCIDPIQANAQSKSWLDTPQKNWNVTGAKIPKAPQSNSAPDLLSRCGTEARPATTAADRELVNKGWRLYGPLLIFGKTSVIRAMADVDGMCRPMNFQFFVFARGKFAGTLSPSPMNSRSDASATEIHLFSASRLRVEYARYTPSDPLCCPSTMQSVEYTIERGLVIPSIDETKKAPANTSADEATVPVEGIVTGMVEYKERIALLPDAQLRIAIVDSARQVSAPAILAEESIVPAGNVPITFRVRYNRSQVDPTHEYRLQVSLRSGGHLWENAESCPVITNGVSAGVRVMLRLSN